MSVIFISVTTAIVWVVLRYALARERPQGWRAVLLFLIVAVTTAGLALLAQGIIMAISTYL